MQPELIAARIVGEEIRLLNELQKMAANPRIFSFMCQIVDGARNGNTPKPAGTKHAANGNGTPKNGLTEAALQVCQEMGTKITIARVTEQLENQGFKFVTKRPKAAVADVLRRYTDTKLKITTHGIGGDPNIYRWVEEASNATA